ncbi:MAG: helix-turn-helix domain-containing protein [Cetobacterium sp.]|uniref:helix-turn-helix domain-containing protein n=1 Tax=Cetobacterium sp. TaxID=2071632 RepID=UPI003F37CC7C
MKYYDFLKQKRIELGYSTRQLGGKISLSGSYISLVENGKTSTPPTEETLGKLVIALKLTKIEINMLYNLIDEEILPERVKNKIKQLEKQLLEQKKEVNILDDNCKNNSCEQTELEKEIYNLNEKQKEKVLKFINEYIK